MTQSWYGVRDGLGFGGYVAWEAAHEAPPAPGQRRLVPLYVRLKPPGFGSLALRAAIAASLALPDVLFSAHERAALEAEAERAGAAGPGGDGWPFEVRLVAWCPRSLLNTLPPYWEVLHVGPSVVMEAELARPPGMRPVAAGGDAGPMLDGPTFDRPMLVRPTFDGPVLAVIDDGIAFLNARFRAAPGATRFAAIWLQAQERLDQSASDPDGDVLCGRVLTRADIDAMLAAGGEEAAMYAQVNRSLLPRHERSPTNHRVAHGTHVTDLAAGADPWAADPAKAMRLLAVQLPPAAIRDTGGRRLEGYVVQGMRWILGQVLARSENGLAGGGAVPPLVINLSIGSLAGPGDETAFLADWMRFELARHARIAPDAEVRIVAAYGNARRARLVARAELRRAAPIRLDWRLLPDDHSASFLELRVDAGKTRGLRLSLIPPAAAGLPVLEVDWPMAGEGFRLGSAQGPVAAVTATQEADHALLHLTIAPSAGVGPVALAPPGLWRVELATRDAGPVRVTARVQRDDTPFSYRLLGRQSWLDHAEGWDWDPETRDYTAPSGGEGATGCPVTREGTAAAFAGADHPGIYFVGAVRPDSVRVLAGRDEAAPPEGNRASRYSASGAVHLRRPDESAGPSLAARGDDGTVLTGRRAAGVVSGSVARMSGTSMAAPLVARRLLEYFAATPATARSAEAERRALLGHAQQPFSPLTGQGVLVDPPIWEDLPMA